MRSKQNGNDRHDEWRSNAGRKGGLVRTAKGFAKMNPERRREIAIAASKKAAELRTKQAQQRKLNNKKAR